MTFSDTAMMELGITQSTNIHNTRSLIRTLKYVLDILQTEEAFTVEEYKHTHKHTHTHTNHSTIDDTLMICLFYSIHLTIQNVFMVTYSSYDSIALYNKMSFLLQEIIRLPHKFTTSFYHKRSFRGI